MGGKGLYSLFSFYHLRFTERKKRCIVASKADMHKLIKQEIEALGFEDFLAKYEVTLDEAKQELDEVEAFIKKHPFLSVAGAVVIGYYLRKIFE